MGEKTEFIPVYEEILGDLNTPVSAFIKLGATNSFLLESVTGGENVARYSYIGLDPFFVVKHENGTTTAEQNGKSMDLGEDPISALERLVGQFSVKDDAALPPFVGGAVGYFSWEAIGFIEKIKFENPGGSDYPLAHFLFPKSLMVFDHAQSKIMILVLAVPGEETQAKDRIQALRSTLLKPIHEDYFNLGFPKTRDVYEKARSNTEKTDYMSAVERVKQHIYDGDVFQLVLSQKFHCESDKKPFDVYRLLRSINPSPYMYYFNFPNYQIIGSSPEILSSLQNGTAVVRPIAGTRPMPELESEKHAMIQDLLADEKERSEHIMLVDLGRNDLGRVCDYATIEANELMVVEEYSHVMHIVSHVTGKLRSDKNAFDVFRATFPAGTLSGAPKVRAIEIIEELEPSARGPYGGALGYFDFRGNMDLCIIIRTILANENGFTVQAGAGIVADSDPESEYFESQNKARGMLLACLE
ncbi:MAG: chorismate-binding protein [bacterium]|nr:chorismate-binding protein [bacterium]